MHQKMFPILGKDKELLRAVPWWLVEAHEAQAQCNHSQSVATLASRGGLSLSELVAVLEDRRWHAMEQRDAFSAVDAILLKTRND